ncbi:sensor histidine kinase [Kitasatospora sp. NPDC048407]|uniref:sensor histidine kinase n=1 Tax=Kitasatospora sp. NPDC048407 TaxID=3364051 RepID=UPI003713B5BE
MNIRPPSFAPLLATALRSVATIGATTAALLRSAGCALIRLGPHLVPSTERHPPLFASVSRRWVRVVPYAVVVVFVGYLLPFGIVHLHTAYGVGTPVAAAVVIAQCVPLLGALGRPLAAWWLVLPASAAGAVLTAGTSTSAGPWPWPVTTLLGYLLLMLTLALRENWRTLLAVWLVTTLTTAAAGAAATRTAVAPLPIALCGAVLLLGRSLRGHGEARRLLAEQQQISEAEREQRTLLEERARIARELHDAVAHHLSAIAVHADSAPHRISGLPPEAAEEFGTIAAAARGSLTEMRRLLADRPDPVPLPDGGFRVAALPPVNRPEEDST